MKICVTASGPSPDSAVDARFGRCRYFMFVNTETMQFEPHENQSSGASGGAGVQSATFVAGQGVKTVLTGNVGPRAYETLRAAGVEIITGFDGMTVQEAVRNYLAGNHRPASGATVSAHSGLKG